MVKESQKPEKSGLIPLVIGMLLVAAMGLGVGIGARALRGEPHTQAHASKTQEAGPVEPKDAPKDLDKAPTKTDHAAKTGSEDEMQQQTPQIYDPADDVLTELLVTPFEPVLTNLREPRNVWIRLEGSILSKKDTEVSSKLLAEQAGHQIMAYLRTTTLSQIDGPSGLQHINEDLNEVMRTFSNGSVRQVLISGFIVE